MSELKLLETERLVLSGWRIEQLDDLVRLHGDPQVARYLTAAGLPWSEAAARTALEHWIDLFQTRRLGKLRVHRKSDGALLGRAGYGIHAPTGEPEIGYSLYPQFWGQGYATEAAAGLRDWLFAETKHDHFIGMADSRNAASLAVLARIGMTPTHVEPADLGLSTQFLILHKTDCP